MHGVQQDPARHQASGVADHRVRDHGGGDNAAGLLIHAGAATRAPRGDAARASAGPSVRGARAPWSSRHLCMIGGLLTLAPDTAMVRTWQPRNPIAADGGVSVSSWPWRWFSSLISSIFSYPPPILVVWSGPSLDFDGDGKLDLWLKASNRVPWGDISVLGGNGTGGLVLLADYPIGTRRRQRDRAGPTR